jgi:CDP-diglyceride synthetase
MKSPYQKLALVISINTVLMFLITYVMIDSIDHFYFNINRIYMALLMAAPMVVLMLLVMRSMYDNKKLNLLLYAAFIGLFILIFSLTRTQTPVGNEQFLRSMIPHHSSAILMCEQSNLTDTEIITLCDEIVQTQIEEIIEMEEILSRY